MRGFDFDYTNKTKPYNEGPNIFRSLNYPVAYPVTVPYEEIKAQAKYINEDANFFYVSYGEIPTKKYLPRFLELSNFEETGKVYKSFIEFVANKGEVIKLKEYQKNNLKFIIFNNELYRVTPIIWRVSKKTYIASSTTDIGYGFSISEKASAKIYLNTLIAQDLIPSPYKEETEEQCKCLNQSSPNTLYNLHYDFLSYIDVLKLAYIYDIPVCLYGDSVYSKERLIENYSMQYLKNLEFLNDREKELFNYTLNSLKGSIAFFATEKDRAILEKYPFLNVYVPSDNNFYDTYQADFFNNQDKISFNEKLLNNSQSKIHPALYAYLANNHVEINKYPYFEYQIINASNLLYETNNPNILYYIFPWPLAEDIIKYFKNSLVIFEGIFNKEYNIEKIDSPQKFELVNSLVIVDEENLEKAYKFIEEMIPEFLDYFEHQWTLNDINRLSILNSLKLKLHPDILTKNLKK